MTAFIPNGIKDFIWGLLPVFMIKYEEFQKKKKATVWQLSSRRLSKVRLASPKQIVCDMGAANLWKTRTIQKTEGKTAAPVVLSTNTV